jgi:ribonuclease BN (tRNA processing enzyme)
MKLIPLGTNGYHPSFARQTSSYLALFDDAAFLLDAGTGTGRIREPAVLAEIQGYDTLYVLLSHYHVDHVVGLYSLFQWPGKRIIVHAPTCPFMQANPREAIERLFTEPLNSHSLEMNRIEVAPLNAYRMTIGGHAFTFWPQQHPGGSVGMRIDDELAYMTDTIVMPENAAHAKGVKLLMHELWLTDEEAAADPDEARRHTTFTPLADFLKTCAPKKAMAIHFSPPRTDEEIRAMATALSKASGIPVEAPVEGRVYEI